MKFRFELFFFVTLFYVVMCQDDPVVETDLGKIRGSFLKTVRDRDIAAFRGIRYAQAPVDEKRFKAPVAVQSWSDTVLDASKDGYMCPQPYVFNYLMSEDCLVLNVYTRDLTGKKPVMVYIHGGANVLGSSHSQFEAGPEYLLDYEIVLVTLNYRLAALGFLSTGTDEAPGNYGYLDQVMALQWVHDHISKFGGNSESVTIFGLSAGAMAVSLHLASPLSKGLFHRAIAMSGSATNHFDINNVGWTEKLARYTSCPLYNPKDVVDCLRKVSWETIVDVCSKWEPYGFTNMKWNYQVDGHFLLDTPTNIFSEGKFNKVPILTGISKDELTHSVYHQEFNKGLLNDISVNFDKYAPEIFLYSPEQRAMDTSTRIQTFYLNNKTIQDQPLSNFGVIFSDAVIGHGVHRLVELARQHVDVYYYRTDFVGRYSLYTDADGKPWGVGHADDIQYILKSIWFAGQIGLDDGEMFMVDRISGWLTSFSQTGIPDEITWLPSNSENVYIMFNDKDIRLGDEPYLERYQLWDDMFPVKANACASIDVTWVLTAGALALHVFAKI